MSPRLQKVTFLLITNSSGGVGKDGVTLSGPMEQQLRKLRKSGTVGACRSGVRGSTPPQFESQGVLPPGKFGKYMCKSVQFGSFWGHQVIKSGTKNRRFSVPLLKVGRNLPSLPCRFRGPCYGGQQGASARVGAAKKAVVGDATQTDRQTIRSL